MSKYYLTNNSCIIDEESLAFHKERDEWDVFLQEDDPNTIKDICISQIRFFINDGSLESLESCYYFGEFYFIFQTFLQLEREIEEYFITSTPSLIIGKYFVKEDLDNYLIETIESCDDYIKLKYPFCWEGDYSEIYWKYQNASDFQVVHISTGLSLFDFEPIDKNNFSEDFYLIFSDSKKVKITLLTFSQLEDKIQSTFGLVFCKSYNTEKIIYGLKCHLKQCFLPFVYDFSHYMTK